jgi:hypothetical protein
MADGTDNGNGGASDGTAGTNNGGAGVSDVSGDIGGGFSADISAYGGGGTSVASNDVGGGGVSAADIANGISVGPMQFTAGDAATLGNDITAVATGVISGLTGAAVTAATGSVPAGAGVAGGMGALFGVLFAVGDELAHTAGGTGQVDALSHAFNDVAVTEGLALMNNAGLGVTLDTGYGAVSGGVFSNGQMGVEIAPNINNGGGSNGGTN